MDRPLDEALKVLGIPADSDQARVTNAYRRLARATHPDMSSDPDAAERFAILASAYRLASASAGDRTAAPPLAPGEQPGVVSSHLRPPVYWARPPVVAGPVRVRAATRQWGAGGA